MAVYQRVEVSSSMAAISAKNLIAGKKFPFDVYTKDNGEYRSLFIKGAVFDRIAGTTLSEKKISEVYISFNDQGLLDHYLSVKQLETETSAPLKINPLLFEEYSNTKKKYFAIERKLLLLMAGTKINFSIFVMNMLVITPLIEAEEYSPCMIEKAALETKGDLLIENEDIPLYHDCINSIMDSDKTEAFIKAVAVKENMKIVIKDLFEDPRSGDKVQQSQQIVSNMIDCVLTNASIAKDLLDLMSFDYYTYTHSVNVAVMSIGLGAEMNMDRSDLEDLGVGALLHDIGKSTVPNSILNKQGKLSYNEYMLMQSHVVEGRNILEAHSDLSDKSMYAVSQHHEKMSGKGYPLQLLGHKIDSFGKITAIADCFDALTTQRPYKSAYSPFHALSIISKEKGDYDPEFLAPFIRMLAKQ